MNMQKYIPEYEKLAGRKLDTKVIRIIELLDAIGKQFESMGRNAAARKRPVASDNVFRAWAKKIFDDDLEMAEVMADLMQRCYMDGYNKVKTMPIPPINYYFEGALGTDGRGQEKLRKGVERGGVPLNFHRFTKQSEQKA